MGFLFSKSPKKEEPKPEETKPAQPVETTQNTEPTTPETKVEEPAAVEPVVEEAKVEEVAVAEEAKVEEAPVVDEAKVEEVAVVDEAKVEEAVVEEAKVEKPVVEEAVEAPVVQEVAAVAEEAPVAEEAAVVEEAVVEAPVVKEEAVVEEVVAEEAAVVEAPVVEEVIVEVPVVEAAVVEEVNVEAPVVEEVVQPKTEERLEEAEQKLDQIEKVADEIEKVSETTPVEVVLTEEVLVIQEEPVAVEEVAPVTVAAEEVAVVEEVAPVEEVVVAVVEEVVVAVVEEVAAAPAAVAVVEEKPQQPKKAEKQQQQPKQKQAAPVAAVVQKEEIVIKPYSPITFDFDDATATLYTLKLPQPLQSTIADIIKAVSLFSNVVLNVQEISVTEVVKISPFNIMPVLQIGGTNLAGLSAIKYLTIEEEPSDFEQYSTEQERLDQYLQIIPLVIDQVLAFKALEQAKSTDNDKINALNKLVQLLKPLNDSLINSTFLLGHELTVADIAMAVALKPVFEWYFGPKKRAELVALTRWFNTTTGQKSVIKTLGYPIPIQSKDVYLMPDLVSIAAKPEPKKEDPLAKLPRSTMSLDAIKKLYCMARPYNPEFAVEFWPQFDAEGWECFEVDFKYSEDFPVEKKLYMAENGIAGFISRAERTTKNVFVVLNLFEQNGFFQIKGAAIVRGNREINAKEVPFALAEVADAEEYAWSVVDISSDEGKAKFLARFCAEQVDGTDVITRIHLK